MKPRRSPSLGLAVALFALLAAAGCNVIPPVQPDPTRYYVLSGPTLAEAAAATPSAGALLLGLKPVEVAPYLHNVSLVVRANEHEIAFASEARWAEPLAQEIGSALRQRLQTAPSVARVFSPPFPVEPSHDFDVSVQVLRCEGVREHGGRAVARFAATIEISTAGEKPQLMVRKTFIAPDAAWDGKDYGRLAALLSEGVTALSQEVVAALPEKK